MKIPALFLLCLVANLPALAQDQPSDSSTAAPPPDQWNLFYQATSVGQYHGNFNAPYEGPLSFQNYPERDVSLTTTLFFGARLYKDLALYFDPEIAGGRGLSAVDGIANAPNGELPRVQSAMPKPYIARLYLSQDFGFGSEVEKTDSDDNQLAGERPMNRYTVAVGRFAASDFFDDNKYTHDPRTQFLAWGVMINGAWDYPADTHGYTWGMIHELHTRNWSLRYAAAAEPTKPNGGRFDRRLLRDRGDIFEVERRYSLLGHPGAVRLLGYVNHTDSGSYADAIRLGETTNTTPDVTAVHRPGTRKYGTGLSADQEIASDLGVFLRLGWNDGKTQDFAFTAIDRLASAGVSVKGTRWERKDDVAATSFTASGISGVHALYLARGGLDFIIGDGRLNYAPEYVWESYYSAKLLPSFFATLDVQRVENPAYNHDRGPIWIASLRLHMEFGIKPWIIK